MGIDARVYLPGNVRVEDVASVLGILHGLPCHLEPLTVGDDARVCRVPGANVLGDARIPQMATIVLRRPNGDAVASFFYHFEGAGGRRCVSDRATPRTVAAFRALADFFGGRVDANDCDDEEADYVVPDRRDEENHPEDGPEWDALQRRISEVEPLASAKPRGR